MTIASTTSKVSYNGSGSTGPFPITYKFTKNADITATKRSSAGVETVLALTTDYTLTGAGDAAGGSLTLNVALAVGESLVIARTPGIVQEVDYVENSAFPAETHESALDLLTTICQSLQEQIDRSVKVEISSTTNPDDLLAELAVDVASAAASAATATTQAGLANTARIAAELAETNAEAAAASIPTFAAFGETLAATTTASNARAALELGTAALVNTGSNAGNVPLLDASAALTLPSQPAFLATLTADLIDVTGAGNYTVVCDNEVFDRGSNYNTGTGIFTAPVTGIYRFDFYVFCSGLLNTHTSADTRIVCSNRTLRGALQSGYALANNNGNLIMGFSSLVDMDAGDTAYPQVSVDNGTVVVDIVSASSITRFSGHLVC